LRESNKSTVFKGRLKPAVRDPLAADKAMLFAPLLAHDDFLHVIFASARLRARGRRAAGPTARRTPPTWQNATPDVFAAKQ
jgi:hypothetical protein